MNTYASRLEALSHEQKLVFYETLSHGLTVAVRMVWSDAALSDAEKVECMKHLNEIMHCLTAKSFVLRRGTHEWTEHDVGATMQVWMNGCPAIRGLVASEVARVYRYARHTHTAL